MHPVSTQQHHAATTGGMPEPEQIDDTLWSVPMAMPGELLSYTLSVVHLAPSGAVTVVDPGWGGEDALTRLDAFLHTVGRTAADVRSIVVTHAHPDHIGLAGRLRSHSGASLILARRELEATRVEPVGAEAIARLESWGMPAAIREDLVGKVGDRRPERPPLDADVLLEDGDTVPIEGARWTALATPGHTAGHLCIVDDDRRVILTGDHVLPTVYPGLGLGGDLGTNPLADYLASLRRLEPYDDYEVVPGHGYRFTGLGIRRRGAARHALRRAREVREIIGREPGATTWEVASQLTWSAGWENMQSGFLLFSGLSQTEMYRAFVESGGLESADAVAFGQA